MNKADLRVDLAIFSHWKCSLSLTTCAHLPMLCSPSSALDLVFIIQVLFFWHLSCAPAILGRASKLERCLRTSSDPPLTHHPSWSPPAWSGSVPLCERKMTALQRNWCNYDYTCWDCIQIIIFRFIPFPRSSTRLLTWHPLPLSSSECTK